MEENRNYSVSRYGNRLQPGHKLKIEHILYRTNMDISTLITLDAESLESMRQESINKEQEIYESIVEVTKKWEEQAAMTQTIDWVLEYLRIPEVEHTNNKWGLRDNWCKSEEISNRVYRMDCHIFEDTKYDREKKQDVPVTWYVTWKVRLNSPIKELREKIAGQDAKRYKDKEAAMKYLAGRKKAYSHLFKEISPAIPFEYKQSFMMHGVLLPGYTVEEQKQETED